MCMLVMGALLLSRVFWLACVRTRNQFQTPLTHGDRLSDHLKPNLLLAQLFTQPTFFQSPFNIMMLTFGSLNAVSVGSIILRWGNIFDRSKLTHQKSNVCAFTCDYIVSLRVCAAL